MRSGSARSSSASRWRTTGRRRRRTSSRSSGDCSPLPGPSSAGIGPERNAGGRSAGRRSPPTTEGSVEFPPAALTRFAPAPTGYLHLGHVANGLWVWGAGRLAGAEVLLRLRDAGLVYACRCTRMTFATWAREHGGEWTGPGCPGACRAGWLPEDAGTSLRVDLGAGSESFDDLLLGARAGDVAMRGDLTARDREGNWTYAFAVVIDDLRQGVDLVVRGEDLADETPRQVRLAKLLGRDAPPRFLDHPLIRSGGGKKLSKSDGDTGVRDLRAAGWTPGDVRSMAGRLGEVPAAIAS